MAGSSDCVADSVSMTSVGTDALDSSGWGSGSGADDISTEARCTSGGGAGGGSVFIGSISIWTSGASSCLGGGCAGAANGDNCGGGGGIVICFGIGDAAPCGGAVGSGGGTC